MIVCGAGGAAANGFIRALQMEGERFDVVGVNASPRDLLLAPCSERHVIPLAGESGHLEAIRSLHPDFVHAQPDEEVLALAGSDLPTLLPALDVVEVCQDKWLTYEVLRDAAVPVPRSWLVEGALDLDRTEPRGVWVRKRSGAGGSGALRYGSRGYAERWIMANGGFEAGWMAAEALSTRTVTVQQLWRDGKLVVTQQRSRRSWANARNSPSGVSGSTGVGETTSHANADDAATRAVKAVDASPNGLYGVDMVLDYDNHPRVTEINPGRFFTTAPEFFATAGFNMAALYVYLGVGGSGDPLDPVVRFNPLPDGLMWVRGMDERPVLTDEAELERLSRFELDDARV